MGLLGAMNSAVSALDAQAQQLSLISNNLANSSTPGYKTVTGSFADVLSGLSSSTSYDGGGVSATPNQGVTTQGTIGAGTSTTNLAIDGNGMFVVQNESGATYFTRDGDFTQDASGNLVLDGTYTLQGWPLDSSGNIESADTNSVNGLTDVNVNRFATSAEASSTVTMTGNLPADATAGAVFTSSVAVIDSLGSSQTVPLTWTKSDTSNEWTVSIGDPTDASGDQTGTIGGTTSYTVDFTSSGALSSITDADGNAVTSPTITVASWDDGASTTNPITLDAGTSGNTDGLTQFSSDSSTPTTTIKSTQNGFAFGTIDSVEVGTDGTVTATYSSGQELAIFKVPIATFADENGLSAQSGDVYTPTVQSGSYTLSAAGTGGAGKIDGSSLEGSTVDTSSQFSLMIIAQQAYSAASQVISTANSMYTTLLDAVRS
jgi:flagellar hook protein FlgE